MKIASAISTCQKSQRNLIRFWVDSDVSLIILCYKPLLLQLLLQSKYQMASDIIPKVVMLVFIFNPNASCSSIHPPRSPSTRRLGLCKKKATNWQRLACSSLTTSSPQVSLSQSSQYHNLGSITLSTCYHVRPLNGLKVSLSPFVWESTGFLANQIWGHFYLWPSEHPWSRLTFSIPQELRVGYFAPLFHPLCKTVLLVSGYLENSVGLNTCISVKWRKHALPCNHFHTIVNFLLGVWFCFVWPLFFPSQKRNGLTA